MPAPHHSVFTGRMPFLLPNKQRQMKAKKTIFETSSLTVSKSFTNSLLHNKQWTLLPVQSLLPHGCEWVNVSSVAGSPG